MKLANIGLNDKDLGFLRKIINHDNKNSIEANFITSFILVACAIFFYALMYAFKTNPEDHSLSSYFNFIFGESSMLKDLDRDTDSGFLSYAFASILLLIFYVPLIASISLFIYSFYHSIKLKVKSNYSLQYFIDIEENLRKQVDDTKIIEEGFQLKKEEEFLYKYVEEQNESAKKLSDFKSKSLKKDFLTKVEISSLKEETAKEKKSYETIKQRVINQTKVVNDLEQSLIRKQSLKREIAFLEQFIESLRAQYLIDENIVSG